MSESTDNPLLEPFDLPPFSRIRPEHALPAVEAAIADARATVDKLRGLESPTFTALVEPLELAEERIDRVFSPVSHLNGVCSTPGWRTAYQDCLERVTAFQTDLSQDAALYGCFKGLADGEAFETLEAAQRKAVTDALRDFRLSGVSLPEAQKKRFGELAQAMSRLGAKFEENVLDSTDAWSLEVSDEDRLAGIPDDIVRQARERAAENGATGWRLGLDLPTFLSVIHHARDRSLREAVYRAWATRASDQRDGEDERDNGPVMDELLALRHETAGLTGFDHYADYSLATKMAPSREAVESFLADLARRARPRAEAELAEVTEFARDNGGPDRLEPWDVNFWGERLKEERYALRDDELRPFFPLPRVLEGLFDVAARLFGIRIEAREGVEAWHEDVRYFDVHVDGDVVAGFFLDPYARPAKRSGAWMDVCTGRLSLSGRAQRPVAYLTLNASPPGDGDPALMTHDEVVTLFHEFGHGLHHMLTRVDVPSLSGIEGVEWDAVELPSQFLENWCWRREALDGFARHYQTGEPLPEALFERLTASRRHMAAMAMVRQLEFALFDLRLHAGYDPARGARVMETLAAVREEVAVVRHPDWNRFPHSFSHIFGGGYAAGYYSYLWAEVLAADAFSVFTERGVFDVEAGRAFRDQVLAVGGSRPALESFRAFRGREPDPAALLEQYGIAA